MGDGSPPEGDKVLDRYEYTSSICSYHPETNQGLKKTSRILSQISEHLHYYTLIAIPVIVNSLTVCLNLGKNDVTNSNLVVIPAGLGKSTLTHKILAESNPKYMISLPDRIYESLIADLPIDDFRRKVWVVDDLITSFGGLSTKQREQLMGFFNSALSKRRYERQKKPPISDIKISCMFGLATENYDKYKKKMLQHTFLERVIPIKYSFDKVTVKDICRRNLNKDRSRKPKVVLPFRKNDVEISIPSELNESILDCAMKLQGVSSLSGTRGTEYIQNFVRASALLNNRKEACMCDINLFRQILPLHKGLSSDSWEANIRSLILERSMKGERLMGRQIKDELNANDTHISDVLSKIREDVFHRKISLERGYDYEYWL